MANTETMGFEPFFNDQLLSQLDQETMIWSGGFQRHPNYSIIRAQGELVVSQLVHMIDNDNPGFWWQCSLIHDIAKDMRQSIPFNPEYAGQLKKVRSTILDWAAKNDYLQTE